MAKFTPTWVRCLQPGDSYRFECTTGHPDANGDLIPNTYRFSGKPLKYLIKNEADYKELVALPIFEDFEAPEEEEVSAPSETTKEKKLREQKENEDAKATAAEVTKETPETKAEKKAREKKEAEAAAESNVDGGTQHD